MDVFFQEPYCRLYEEERIRYQLFSYENEFGKIIYPFLLREIPLKIKGVQYYDVITPYGYGGPLAQSPSCIDKVFPAFSKVWEAYCSKHRIVSEFVRFHLFDNADIRTAFYGQTIQANTNIVIAIMPDPDKQWMSFEHKVRKNVNKALRSGLRVIRDPQGKYLDDFMRIYNGTMDRNHAMDFYYFGRAYFERILSHLPENSMMFHVLQDETVVSSELVLCSENYCYSFLGGTDSNFNSSRPNDLLKFEAINWCRESGRKKYILGGGYHGEDGIYRYKKSFAPYGAIPFYIGKKIWNDEIYQQLCLLTGNNSATAFFPAYRA